MPYAKFLKQTNRYNHIDSDTIKMCILGNFLSSDVGYHGIRFFREWFYDAQEATSGNITVLEKEGNNILLTNMYSEEENPTELKMTRDQFITLLDQWSDAVCIKKPSEITITEINGEFIFETKT